ncbi:MAG: hypothetical protein Q9162_005313 [Coniocarpon cinnabarinum]
MADDGCADVEQINVHTAPQEPPYHYDRDRGYEDWTLRSLDPNGTGQNSDQDTLNANIVGEQAKEAHGAENILEFEDEDDDEIFDDEIISSNLSDYTKTYNRQRRFNDPDTDASQLPRTNPQRRPKANVAALIDDQISSLSRHAGKLQLDEESARLKSGSSGQGHERSDRATNEQVLDPRTRMILLQMINRGIVSEIYGCISTGKEANVYHAILDQPDYADQIQHFAVKIYKTAILHFKDRSKYVSGEFRFQKGFPKRSNRGMVRLWAEKEFRNLKRMHTAGLPVPEPIYLRSHVLVMRFVGSTSTHRSVRAAPLLRDVEFENMSSEQQVEQWQQIYRHMLCCMRKLYQECKLVHADLSEYNTLYDIGKSKLVIIDVSQSVEHDHPRSLEFLRMDIKNVSGFFARKGVDALTEPSVYDFVTRDHLPNDTDSMDKALHHLQSHPVAPATNEEVFRNQYIPQTLNQVLDHEYAQSHLDNLNGTASGHEHLLAKATESLTETIADDVDTDDSDKPSDEAEDEYDWGSSDNAVESSSGYKPRENKPRGKRFEDKSARKEHKSAVKEEKRERRKMKMPKQMKKKLVNSKSRGHKK